MALITTRALNRATLERQLLLRRHQMSALDAVRHLVGLLAQAPWSPYYSLWSRLDRFDPNELGRALLDRAVVRIVVMRGTIHLLTAEDALELRPLTQPIMDRDLRTNAAYSRQLEGVDLERVAVAARAAVEAEPLTAKQVGIALQRRWRGRDSTALAHAARNLLPLVQVPPRAVWGMSGRTTYTTLESWIGQPLHPTPSIEAMVVRYLGAFGPASVADVQVWSGLSRLAEVVERLRPQLDTFSDEHGRELFDLRDGPRPDEDTPAPPRFLPDYDNLLRSHGDRTRVIADEHRRALSTANGVVPGTVLVDGVVAATWWITRAKKAATLHVKPFARLTKPEEHDVRREANGLLQFAAADAGEQDVYLESVT
ncbi:MAG TPA: winged helix DNA-binding domain-containing protein [Acidimicrobiales bacterium]